MTKRCYIDMNNNVAECSGANVFMQKNNTLYTPPRGHIMPGITRETVLEICKNEEIPVKEQHFDLRTFKQAEAAFFTGTAAEIVGLNSIDDYLFPLKWETSMGYRLMKQYKNEVLDIRKK